MSIFIPSHFRVLKSNLHLILLFVSTNDKYCFRRQADSFGLFCSPAKTLCYILGLQFLSDSSSGISRTVLQGQLFLPQLFGIS